MVSEIRKRCGNKFPIMYRIDLSLMLNATYGERMKKIKSRVDFSNCLMTLLTRERKFILNLWIFLRFTFGLRRL